MRFHLTTPIRFSLAMVAAFAVSLSAETSLIDQARAALNRGDADAAISLMEKAVAQSPKSAEAHFHLGNAYSRKAQQAGMFDAAKYAGQMKDAFEKAVALNPKYVDARFGLVNFYTGAPGFMGGSHDKALEQAKVIKSIDPIAGHRAYAVVYTQQKKVELAKKEYTDAIREQPGSAKAHGYFGQYLVDTEKNYPAATAEFEKALKLDPAYMPAFYHLGRTAALANANLPRGEEALKKYLTHTPKEGEPALANTYLHLGTIYEKTGREAEAKQSYQAALKLNPSLKQAAEALKRIS